MDISIGIFLPNKYYDYAIAHYVKYSYYSPLCRNMDR